jgi:hypothetical protein
VLRATEKNRLSTNGIPINLGLRIIQNAGIAQLVEQLICNQQVVGSNPTAGFRLRPVVLNSGRLRRASLEATSGKPEG